MTSPSKIHYLLLFYRHLVSGHIVGSIMLIIFKIPMNIINMIMDMNPILENNIPILSLLFKELKEASENIITIATAMVTNIERLGNSAGENDEIVSNIRNPPMMVVSIISKSFGLKFIWTLPLRV